MIDGRRVLGLVVARGSSKGLARKNAAPLAGKPLLAWAIAAGRESTLLDAVVCSTEDDQLRALALAEGAQCPFARPAELARDDTPATPVYRHALEHLAAAGRRFDLLAPLQPTTPFKTGADVDAALTAFVAQRRAPMLRAVTAPRHHPHWCYQRDQDGLMRFVVESGDASSRAMRQMLPEAFALSGLVDVIEVAALQKAESLMRLPFVGLAFPRLQSQDIDGPADLAFAQWLATHIASGVWPTSDEDDHRWMRLLADRLKRWQARESAR